MKRIDFKHAVIEHPALKFRGLNPFNEVEVMRLRDGAVMAVPWDDIPNQKWSDYEETFRGLRDAHVMKGMSRIVGYFARTENWNRSKLAELRDRRSPDADYGVPEGKVNWNAPLGVQPA